MNGILLVDKPAGWTSSDVVAKLRGVLHEKRIGHSGTLDPMATGLLVVLVGRATRAASFAEAQDKRYLAGLRLGLVTDTQDVTGTAFERHEVNITTETLREALTRFTGEIEQVPPMYSAIKVKGQKLYQIARRGGEVERAARSVTVSALELVGREGEDWLLDVRCSKGTYVRTLCHDVGAALGCGGCMSALRRLAAGDYRVDEAHTLPEIIAAAEAGRAEEYLLPLDGLFAGYPALTADTEAERRIRCGNSAAAEAADGTYRVYAESGEFLALCRAEEGRLITIKSFFEVS